MKKLPLLVLLSLYCLLKSEASPTEHQEQYSQKESLETVFAKTGTKTFDNNEYAKWQHILSQYIVVREDQANLFRYAEVTKSDQELLSAFIEESSKLKLGEYNSNTQKAFWINLYNAITIKTILDYYPVKSIRHINISPGIFSIGPWNKKLVTVSNVRLSLNNIEHNIIRPIWKDNRIHYLVNCASLGCPDLWPYPIASENIEKTLTKAEYMFINSPRGVRTTRNGISISKIYEWYENDFISGNTDIIDYLKASLEAPVLTQISIPNIKTNTHYNWSLNDLK